MKQKKRAKIWCPFPDCFNCPHPDCIQHQIWRPIPKDDVAPPKLPKAKTPEQIERNRQTARAYYQRNKDIINAAQRQKRARAREAKHAEKQHLSHGQIGQRSDPGTSS